MARPPQEAPAPSALAPGLLRYLRANGVDPAELAARFGLGCEDEARDEALLPPLLLSDLVEAVAETLGEPFLGLRLPTELPLRRYGYAELTAQSSATPEEALRRMARYAPLLHPDLEAKLAPGADELAFVAATPRRPRGANRYVHEYVLAHVLTQLRQGGSEPRILRVWFAHPRPPRLEPLHDFFRTAELSFGNEDNGLAFDPSTLETPMRTGDPRMLAAVEELAEGALRSQPGGRSFTSLVEARLGQLLPGVASLVAVGEAMRMSPRTVQRRLEQEGTGFSETLDRVREKLARKWLTDDTRALAEVGYALGFSDLATFSRAFKRWTGKPPGTWRRSR
jgi:AraC-like DNA-binding protein